MKIDEKSQATKIFICAAKCSFDLNEAILDIKIDDHQNGTQNE